MWMMGTPTLLNFLRGSPVGGTGSHWFIGTAPTTSPPATATM
jgi:hypothetical protein